MHRRRVVVQGQVQGVFFREATKRRARSTGVAGWVRNRPDGTVEAVFEGALEAVDDLVSYMQEGPPGAGVDWVDVETEEPEGLKGFEIR
jgi:acylphosphatase